MRKTLEMLICFFATCFMVACSEEETDTTGTVYGRLTDAISNEPIAGANIQITPGGKSTVTGSDGSFEFRDMEAGQYKLQAQKYGYQTNYKQIDVVAGKTASGDMPLLVIEKNDEIELSPVQLYFSGSTKELVFAVKNIGSSSSVNWNISQIDVPWISISPLSGFTAKGKSTQVKVTLDRNLAGENNSTIITVNAGGGSLSLMINVDGTNKPDSGNENNPDDGGEDNPTEGEDVTNGLYAFFEFENSTKDSKRNLNGSGIKTSFNTGHNGSHALDIPATGDAYLSIPEGLIDGKEMSISFWVKDLSDGHIFHVVNSDQNEAGFTLTMKGGMLKFIISNYNLNYQYENRPSFTHSDIGKGWHMITLTSEYGSPSVTKLYIDGEYIDQTTEKHSSADAYEDGIKFIIGGKIEDYKFKASATPMTIDNLRIYNNRCLTDKEVKSIYNFEKQ